MFTSPGSSWKIGRLLGIEIYLHLSLVLFLVFFLLSFGAASTLFIAVLFGCVLLHELGHASAARYYGIPTRGILLTPIGGVAQLARMPADPKAELAITIAGPAVNLLLAGAFSLMAFLAGNLEALFRTDFIAGAFLSQLVWANIILFLFNLLPAYPMDGGRILRAVLAAHTGDHCRATWIAARTGQYFAVALGIAGLLWNPVLIVTAIFIYGAARREAGLAGAQLAGRDDPEMAAWNGGSSPGSDLRPPGTPGAFRDVSFRILK